MTSVFGTIWDYITFSMCLIILGSRKSNIHNVQILIFFQIFIFLNPIIDNSWKTLDTEPMCKLIPCKWNQCVNGINVIYLPMCKYSYYNNNVCIEIALSSKNVKYNDSAGRKKRRKCRCTYFFISPNTWKVESA